MSTRPHPAALPHGELKEIFPDVFFVTGSVRMARPVTFSRNMTVVREGESLTLINSVRLNEAGLAALDALGKVEHVIRIAGFHGMDDPFYKDHYGAKVWAMEGQGYFAGFETNKPPYFEPDAWLTADTPLPFAGAKLFVFERAKPSEGLILLEREGGIVVAGDSLQNWARPDRYFSFLAKPMMWFMGFFKAHNVGPGWLKGAKPARAGVRAVLDLPFDHVLPVHGEPVVGGAKELFRPAIERVSSRV